MSYLVYLDSLAGLTAPADELTEPGYALVPLYRLGNRQAPFDAWRRPESRVPAGLETFWRQAAVSYQLCAFHAVNAVTVGNAFAERILGHQQAFLDALAGGAGDQHGQAIRRLYELARLPLEITAQDGSRMEIPNDWRIAVDFLLTSAESPFRTDQAAFSAEGAPTFPDDLDVALALDLEDAWRRASEPFVALAQQVELARPEPADLGR